MAATLGCCKQAGSMIRQSLIITVMLQCPSVIAAVLLLFFLVLCYCIVEATQRDHRTHVFRTVCEDT